MISKPYIFLILLLPITITFLFIVDLTAKKRGDFVGVGKCVECHATDAIGNQVSIWRASPHARAFRILKTEEAKAVAKKAGVKEPQKDQKCLSCHNTGAGKYEAAYGEGVGCEACHGPASNWYEYENHVSTGGTQSGYKKAVSLGMYPVIGIDSIKFREKMCKRCHTTDRPCVPENVTDKKELELPLEFISDFVFKHPVRK
jgi:hypothetical protein